MNNFVTSRYPALGSAAYRRFWLASFASVGATQLITLGQGWLIFELSGSAMALGYLGAAAALPNILLTLLGGVIADRFDKRRIMMFTSATTTALLALLAWLDYTGQVALWHVLTIAASVSLVTGLDWPARVSFYPLLVERSAFMSAVALNSFIWQATRMAIPAAGGLIIALAEGTWLVFAIGAAGFAVMFIVIAGLKVGAPPATTQSAAEQLREGLRYIWQTTLFRNLLGLTFVGMFFAQSYTQIMPIFADLLESNERGYGYLLSAGGVGSVVGTLIVGSVHRFAQLGRVMLAGATGSVLLLYGFTLSVSATSFYLALACVFGTAIFASVFMITSMTVLQLEVPDHLRGRVMGIHTIGYSLMPLGGLFVGTLAEYTGAAVAVAAGSTIYLLAILAIALAVREVRDLDGQRLQTNPQ
jgi:MFS family permease